MTKDTGDFRQFHSVACREYTLPRDDGSSQPRGWIQGNTKFGPVLEITTSYLHGKHGIQIRILSLRIDNSHSWVRICAGSRTIIPSDTSLTCLPLHSRTVPVSDVQITSVHAYRSMDHSDARVTYIGSS